MQAFAEPGRSIPIEAEYDVCVLGGGVAGAAALAMARGCRDILFAMGETALADAKAGRRTGAVEQVIEVNLYLSGVGFENGGLAAAHAVNNAFSGVGLCPGVMHGELVAFGEPLFRYRPC